MKDVDIYTDGACSGNPGPGGWGVILLCGGTRKELSGFAPDTTNQRMELQAAVSALSALKYPCQVRLFSDSAYLINAFQQNWFKKWHMNGWRNARGESVGNQDLWMQLLELSERHQIQWIKVAGHRDNVNNNRCDELARNAIKNPPNSQGDLEIVNERQ